MIAMAAFDWTYMNLQRKPAFVDSVLSNYFVKNVKDGQKILDLAEIEIKKVLDIDILHRYYRDFINHDLLNSTDLSLDEFNDIYNSCLNDHFKKFQCFTLKELCLLKISISCNQQNVFDSIANKIVEDVFKKDIKTLETYKYYENYH